jgi:hypothetical protein
VTASQANARGKTAAWRRRKPTDRYTAGAGTIGKTRMKVAIRSKLVRKLAGWKLTAALAQVRVNTASARTAASSAAEPRSVIFLARLRGAPATSASARKKITASRAPVACSQAPAYSSS